MDFSSIPEHVLLRIFHYLPFEDRVRLGRVNSRFREISESAISETKVLDFSSSQRDSPSRFTPISVITLVNLCSNNLEKVRFGDLPQNHDHELELVKTFLSNSVGACPRLEKFACNIGDCLLVHRILVIYPKLKSLAIDGYISFPADTVCDSLETLECWCNQDGLQSLIGRVPNLKYFRVQMTDFRVTHPVTNVTTTLDKFFATVPNLESIHICSSKGDFLVWEIDLVNSFWGLKSLMALEAVIPESHSSFMGIISDNTLSKVAQAFPRLRILHWPAFERWLTAADLSALSTLHDLQELTLENVHCRYRSGNLRQLAAGCPRLRKLRLSGSMGFISPTTLTTLLINCNQLSSVELWDLAELFTSAQAVAMLARLAGGSVEPRTIWITFLLETAARRSEKRAIWQSDDVNAALKKLEDEDGVVVKFGWEE